MRLRLAAASLLLGLAALPAVNASAEGPVDVRIVEADDTAFPNVKLLVEVDENGRPADTLSAPELHVVEGDSVANIVSVQRATDAKLPLNIVLAVDTSGSMRGEPIEAAKTAAAAMVADLQPQDVAALVSFSNAARIEQPFEAARDTLLSGVGALQADGNTALYSAVRLSAEVSDTAETRRAVILLSDGEDSGGVSTTSREESIAAAAASGAVFYVIGLEGETLDRKYLEQLATSTGGRYFQAPGPQDLPVIFGVIEQRLRSQFVVTVASAAPAGTGERTVRVEVTRPGRSGAAQLTYSSLQPAPPPTATTQAVQPIAPVPAPEPAVQEQHGSSNAPWLVLAAVVAVAVLVVAVLIVLWLRRRRVLPSPEVIPSPTAAIERPLAARREVPPVARLVGLSGAESHSLRAEPLTVGAALDSQVLLPSGPGVAATHARLWWRDGRAMLHHVGAGCRTLVNGDDADWVSLAPGDRVQFGPYEFIFEPIQPSES